jgi:hypothetical protein
MAALSRDQIKSVEDLKATLERVEVPEWGGDVYVGAMTGAERDAFERHIATAKFENSRAFVAVLCCRDEDGKGLFQPDDIKWLGEKSAEALDRVVIVAARINKLFSKDILDAVKNSVASPSGGSSSGSPRTSE